MKVDTRGMIPLGSGIQTGAINFNTTFDREAQPQSLYDGNRPQAELTPEELDLPVVQIEKQKQKQALQDKGKFARHSKL